MSRTDRQAHPAPTPADADGCRQTWRELETDWSQTMASAAAWAPAMLDLRVDGEWSFLQTLRHLVFVTDAWAARALLGLSSPYHPLGLPPTGMRNPAIPHDPEATTSLAEMTTLRAQRQALVREVLAQLTDAAFQVASVLVRGPGYPRPGTYPVRRCVQTLITEEWHHRRYAQRDLGRLEAARSASRP